MRKALAAIAGAVALALTAACAGADGAAGSDELADGGTFVFAIGGDPGALDPGTAVLQPTNWALAFGYDTLVHQGPDGTITSGVAEKWEVTPTSAMFTLRKDVTCADGVPLTATDVAANVSWIADPANKSPLLGSAVPPGTTVTADDAAGTVSLKAGQPAPFLLQDLSTLWLVCGKGLRDRGQLVRGMAGTGPYVLAEAVPNDHYTFTVRKDYRWGPGGSGTDAAGVPATVVLKVVPSESTAVNLLVTDKLGGAMVVGPDRKRLAAVPAVRRTETVGGLAEFFYNQSPSRVGADPAVRRALTGAVNLDELAGIATGGTGRTPTGLVSVDPRPCRGDSVAGNRPGFDPAAATAALEAAGWRAGDGGVRIKNGSRLALKVAYPSSQGPQVQAAVEYLAAQWRKLGVEVSLAAASDVKLQEVFYASGDWDLGWAPIGVTNPAMLVPLLSGPTPPGGNFAHLDNADYTRLTGEAMRASGDEGCRLWTDAEAALIRSADVVPVAALTFDLAARKARYEFSGGLPVPTSIRMLKG